MKKFCLIAFVSLVASVFLFGEDAPSLAPSEVPAETALQAATLLDKYEKQTAQILALKKENRMLKMRLSVALRELELLKSESAETKKSPKENAIKADILQPSENPVEKKGVVAKLIAQSEAQKLGNSTKSAETKSREDASNEDLIRRQKLADQAQRNAEKNTLKGDRKTFQDKVF